MLNAIIDALGTILFLMGLGLGLPAIVFEEKHPIAVSCLVVVITVLGFFMVYITN